MAGEVVSLIVVCLPCRARDSIQRLGERAHWCLSCRRVNGLYAMVNGREAEDLEEALGG